MSEALLDALDARSGIVCAVGAGGKKTTLYALAGANPGRVGFTCTVHMAKFSRRLGAHALISDEPDPAAALARAAAEHRVVAWARPSQKPGRVAGVAADSVGPCHARAGFDACYVKADGARMRALKAPRADEPQIPNAADRVLYVVSAACFGAALDERIAHRPERVAAVTGLEPGGIITPAAIARLLAAPAGALKGVPAGAALIPVINAVDDAARRDRARAAATAALAATDRFDRVVLTAHGGAEPLVEVVRAS